MAIRFIYFITTSWLIISLFFSCTPFKPVSTTPKEKKEVVERLLMTLEEQNQFKEMDTPEARDAFIEEFWQKRNPHPGTTINDLREEISERVDFCNNWFRESPGLHPGWDTDRGRIYIVLGPPDTRERQDAPYGTRSGFYQNRSYERWTYEQHALTLYFVSSQTLGGFRLEMPPLALHRSLESVKNNMLNGQSSQQSYLTITFNRQSDRININLQTDEIYFEEQGDLYIARFKLLISPEEKGTGEPVSFLRIVKMEPDALLKTPVLSLSIQYQEIPPSLALSPLIIQIEDSMSHKRAVFHLPAPKTIGE